SMRSRRRRPAWDRSIVSTSKAPLSLMEDPPRGAAELVDQPAHATVRGVAAEAERGARGVEGLAAHEALLDELAVAARERRELAGQPGEALLQIERTRRDRLRPRARRRLGGAPLLAARATQIAAQPVERGGVHDALQPALERDRIGHRPQRAHHAQ